jgi:hypothetical protein
MNKTVVSMMIVAVAFFCFAATPASATNVTYTASGTFATPPLSGADMLKLAGYPFSISIIAAEGTKPTKTGTGYAEYTGLQMWGQVFSGLLNTNVPFGCAPGQTGCTQQLGNLFLQIGTKNDTLKMNASIPLIGLTLAVTASAPAPLGTLANLQVAPLKATVNMKSPSSKLVYKDTSAMTVLGVNGMITTTTSAATRASVEPAVAPRTMPAPALVSKRYFV